MLTDPVAVVRRFYELSQTGDPACWDLWAEDAVSVSPPDWPEAGEWRGVDEIRRGFGEWRSTFGPRWWEGIRLDTVSELPDGRVLVDLEFDFRGATSGAPAKQAAGAVYTVREGRIARADHFMDRAAAREAAGIE